MTSTNQRVHQLFCSQIFNQKHGLELKEKKIVELPPEPETDETREIRVYKNWINSMGLDDVYVNYLMATSETVESCSLCATDCGPKASTGRSDTPTNCTAEST